MANQEVFVPKNLDKLRRLREIGGLKPGELQMLEELEASAFKTSEEDISARTQIPEELVPTEATTIPGELAGGISGGLIGGSIGGPPGAIIGALFGGLSGELAQQTIDELSGGEALTFEDAAKRAGLAGGTQAVGEAVGLGLAAGAGKVLGPLAKRIKPETAEAIEAFGEVGGRFTPAQATESRGVDLLENIAEASLFGGGRFSRFKEAELAKADIFLKNVIDEFGSKATPEQVGEVALQAIKEEAPLGARTIRSLEATGEETSLFGEVSSKLFGRVDDAIGTEPIIPTTKVKKTVDKLERFLVGASKAEEITPKALREVPAQVRRRFAVVRDLPETVSFERLQNQRSLTLELAATKDLPRKSKAALTQLAQSLESEMKSTAEAAGPNVFKAFKRANRFHAAGSKRFRTKAIKRLAKKNPEDVANRLFQRGDVSDIRAVKKIVGREQWKMFQRLFLEKMIPAGTDIPRGQAILNNIEKMTEPTLKEIFPFKADKAMLKRFRTAANVLKTAQSKQAEGTGRVLIQLTQGGALLNVLAGGPARGTSGMVLLGPPALARLMTSDVGIKWLSTGFRLPAGTPKASALATKILGFLAKDKLFEDVTRSQQIQGPVVPLPTELQTPTGPESSPREASTNVMGIRG